MEEVKPSYLALRLPCPASLAESLWGSSPEPHRGGSPGSPVAVAVESSHTSVPLCNVLQP